MKTPVTAVLLLVVCNAGSSSALAFSASHVSRLLSNKGGLSVPNASVSPTRHSPFYQSKDDSTYYQYDYDTQTLSSTIVLSKEEQELFRLVMQAREKFSPNTTIRVAGGWVRDKLLRKRASRDIDFVLNDTSGSDFAQLLYDYLQTNHYDDVSFGTSGSEHLQTASIRFRSFNIDFCCLRYEKYSPDSRVPKETKTASVVQDAWRRDLTINSLFYNLNTNQVEDWTEQGLHDLRLGIIATPLAPLATLLEDPLRILRAVRFATQLEFSMDPALKKAARNKRVPPALERKVSKERIGNEIDLVFQTRDPTRGVQLLLETDLMGSVFPMMDDRTSLQASPCDIYKGGLRLLSRTQALASRIFVQKASWDEYKRRYLWYAAFLKPFCDMTTTTTASPVGGYGKRSRQNGSILYQLLGQLKQPSSDIKSVERIIKGVDVLDELLTKHSDMLSLLETNVRFATLSEHDPQWKATADLRWMGYKILKQVGPYWKESLILVLAQQDLTEASRIYRQWVTLLVDRFGLNEDEIFASSKPLLNGSQIQQRALPGVEGVGFRKIMQAQEEWQVRHVQKDGDNREAQLIDYLVHTFPEYTSQQQSSNDAKT